MFVFDVYGTLLDIDAAARQAATEPGMESLQKNWLKISKGWRDRQLRYSWLGSMMGKYDDFWKLTIRALDATLEEHALSSDQKIRARLLSLYSELIAYEEVPRALARLEASDKDLRCFQMALLKCLRLPLKLLASRTILTNCLVLTS